MSSMSSQDSLSAWLGQNSADVSTCDDIAGLIAKGRQYVDDAKVIARLISTTMSAIHLRESVEDPDGQEYMQSIIADMYEEKQWRDRLSTFLVTDGKGKERMDEVSIPKYLDSAQTVYKEFRRRQPTRFLQSFVESVQNKLQSAEDGTHKTEFLLAVADRENGARQIDKAMASYRYSGIGPGSPSEIRKSTLQSVPSVCRDYVEKLLFNVDESRQIDMNWLADLFDSVNTPAKHKRMQDAIRGETTDPALSLLAERVGHECVGGRPAAEEIYAGRYRDLFDPPTTATQGSSSDTKSITAKSGSGKTGKSWEERAVSKGFF